jgi:hypothetical protein
MATSDDLSPPETSGLDTIAATPPVVAAAFPCCLHDTIAGTVSLHGEPNGNEWVLVTASFVCRQLTKITAELAKTLKGVLARGDVEGLYAIDEEFAPFFCPECHLVYCGHCWRQFNVYDDDFPGWLDEIRGRCPHQHERKLVD